MTGDPVTSTGLWVTLPLIGVYLLILAVYATGPRRRPRRRPPDVDGHRRVLDALARLHRRTPR